MTTYTVPAGRYGDYSTAFIQAYIDAKIAGVLDTAPETLNTLNELAAAINDDASFFATMSAANATLQTNIDNLSTAAASARASLQTLLHNAVDAVQADVDTNEADADTAIAAEASARGTAITNLQTTLQGLIDAVQADVNTNESDSDSADAALSGRLDVLEADPTTATALAAVQADVDANETASDNAEAALSGRLDTLETDPTTQTYVDGINTALDARLDTLEADPTTATALTNGLALKADLAGATFTGDVIVDEGDGPTIKLETSQDGNAGIVINGSSGVYAYIDTTNGFGNDNLQVYSANFWVRAINGGTGNVIIDGQLTAGGLVNAANDGDAATAGVPLNGLYHHNGDMKIRLS